MQADRSGHPLPSMPYGPLRYNGKRSRSGAILFIPTADLP